MADEESGNEKTDFVSTKRLKDAWDQGRIPLGRESAGVAALMAALLSAMALAPRLLASLVSLNREALLLSAASPLGELLRFAMEPLLILMTLLALPALAAVAVTLAQTRGGLWLELAFPDFERLSGKGLTRAFTKEFYVDMALLFAKVAVVAFVASRAVRDDLLTLPRLLTANPDAQVAALFAPVAHVAVRVVAVMALFAGVDLALTHYRFREKLKMTREEAKRELKEDEGDPLLKGRRRKRARELAKSRIAIEVPKADAVVVNPTHIAVAIRYRKEEGFAPRVIAKGKGTVAENIRDLARSHGIPIIEDIALARLLYKRVKVGKAIPAETYRAVAAILAFVYRVTGRKPQAPQHRSALGSAPLDGLGVTGTARPELVEGPQAPHDTRGQAA